MDETRELNRRMERVDELVGKLEACPDQNVREQVKELLGTLMDFHGAGLHRAMELLHDNVDESDSLFQTLGSDPLVSGLLLMHGLHPLNLEARIDEALEEVRPALRSHRGDVELVKVEDGVVHLRLNGTCNGCPSSVSTFRNLIETAIFERAPEIEKIEVEGMAKQ